jgi:hypothetical protein
MAVEGVQRSNDSLMAHGWNGQQLVEEEVAVEPLRVLVGAFKAFPEAHIEALAFIQAERLLYLAIARLEAEDLG